MFIINETILFSFKTTKTFYFSTKNQPLFNSYHLKKSKIKPHNQAHRPTSNSMPPPATRSPTSLSTTICWCCAAAHSGSVPTASAARTSTVRHSNENNVVWTKIMSFERKSRLFQRILFLFACSRAQLGVLEQSLVRSGRVWCGDVAGARQRDTSEHDDWERRTSVLCFILFSIWLYCLISIWLYCIV